MTIRTHHVRTAAATVATALLVGVAGASAAAAAPAALTRQAVPVDRRFPSGSAPGYPPGFGSGTQSAYGTATPVSAAATAAQSVGVVVIETQLPYQNAEAAGTGMVLTSDGQVLTNYHVVEGAGTISVIVATTGQTFTATVVGSDQTDDVALLQLQGASGLGTVKVDDDATAVGDSVTAVGNAGGTGTLTAAAGTISSLTASVTAASESSGSAETLAAMIETTADVVAGDSGGPLVDAEGEVVGIDTAASTGSVIDGYAIPIARALAVVDQIRSGAETSTVRVGPAAFLGIATVSGAGDSGYAGGYYGGYARSAGSASGAVVGEVVPGSAAAAAGLTAGGVVTSLDGQTVTSGSDVHTLLGTANPGDQVSIGWTDTAGATHTATVTLGASPVA